jgi:hypothetical protein
MKYQVSVNGKPFLEVTASDDTSAVDRARAELEKKTPKEGGSFEVVVSSEEEGPPDAKGRPRPAGVVSSFGVYHEPHESVREAVEAQRTKEAADKAEAERTAAIEAGLLERLKAAGIVKHDVDLSAIQGSAGSVEVSK